MVPCIYLRVLLVTWWWVFILGTAAVLAGDGATLPRIPAPFEGQLAPTEEGSTAYRFPRTVKAPEGAPNVLLVLTDDVGFGAVSTFGGPIPKPNLDKLASRGLVYNQFHTAGICAPTRAALLTGRNHHQVGMGFFPESPSPYPGYHAILPRSATSVARILRDNGYSTAMFGKDHNVPTEQWGAAGPFDRWPTGRGFDYFYGFIGGDTDQFRPALYLGTEPVEGADRPEDYIFDRDMVSRTIRWLHNQKAAAPDKPFFIYHATGTAHAPQQAPADWIAKFRGKFDHGWDEERRQTLVRQKAMGLVPEDTELAPRPAEIPPWDSLAAAEKKVYARFMEVYAATLAHQDAQFGRLLDELERMGELDNTLVIYIEGDNGTAGDTGVAGSLNEIVDLTALRERDNYDLEWLANNLEILGGPDTYQAVPAGWAFAMSTPFPWFKQVASHLGATRNGMVISWPRGFDTAGQVRQQYHHIIDVMPTILDAAGVPLPEVVDGVPQQPVDGSSMVYSFSDGTAPSPRNTQYYELLGNRAIYHKGWLANTQPRNMPWQLSRPGGRGSDITQWEWELYDLREDFSQSRNLAIRYPQQLEELKQLFDREARRNQVYPVHDSGARQRSENMASDGEAPVTQSVLWGPGIRMDWRKAPPIFFRPFSVEADIHVPEGGAEGVIFAAGSQFGGWSFYLLDGRPVAAASRSPLPGGFSRVVADTSLPPGDHRLVFTVKFRGEGSAVRMELNGRTIAHGELTVRPLILAGLGETLDTGRDTNVPVSPDYTNEGMFSGRINRIIIGVR